MQSLVACKVANLAFLKSDFEILCFNALGFFFISFFIRKGLALPKHCPSCIFITNLLTRVYDHAWGKGFAVALKMFDVFYKKQMYNSVFTGQANASKDRNCIVSMFLTSFNIYFCLVMHASCNDYVS